MAAQHQTRPASSSSGSTYSPPASSFSRPLSTHPQLRLPLSHHGLPRGPTSPENSFSSRSQRYEPLSKTSSSRPSSSSTTTSTTTSTTPKRYSSDPDESSSARASHFFRLSVATAPPSPPVTPFSPGAFPSELEDDEYDEDVDDDERLVQCCPRCRCSLSVQPPTTQQQQVQRARSMDELPSPVRRQTSTRSMSGADRGEAVAAADPAVQRGQLAPRPPPAQPSGLAKFGKRIKARLGTRMGEGGGGGEVRRPDHGGARASGRVEYEEMEEVHWTEI